VGDIFQHDDATGEPAASTGCFRSSSGGIFRPSSRTIGHRIPGKEVSLRIIFKCVNRGQAHNLKNIKLLILKIKFKNTIK
jgi:hypothetical protein